MAEFIGVIVRENTALFRLRGFGIAMPFYREHDSFDRGVFPRGGLGIVSHTRVIDKYGGFMGFWTFVLVAVAISTIATIINNWIRARHGYPLADDEQGSSKLGQQVAALTADSRKLQMQLAGVEDRLRVIERIATDPPARLAKEINEL